MGDHGHAHIQAANLGHYRPARLVNAAFPSGVSGGFPVSRPATARFLKFLNRLLVTQNGARSPLEAPPLGRTHHTASVNDTLV
jgi:hypothetical protein